MWHFVQVSATTFPHVSLSRRVMRVLRQSLYGVVSHGQIFGLFIPLTAGVLIGFTLEANISLEFPVGQILFLTAVCVGFHSRYQSTLISVPHSIRPM